MHQKKRKLHKLHSIPIGLCNKVNHKRLYLVSYSIPLSCMVVLLLVMGMSVGTWSSYKAEAITVGEEGEAQLASVNAASNDASNEISTHAVNDAISLIIDGGTVDNSVTETVQGKTAYHSHSVQVNGRDITAYTLTISGPTNLSGTSTIGGAGGKYGYELEPNTWGYGWGDTSTTDANLRYKTLTTGGAPLDCGSVTNDNLECNKKLTFGARFGEEVATGNYMANVNLQLTATPRVVSSWNDMKYMQDMKAEYCSEPATPAKGATSVPTKTLIDRRDGNSYTIVKLHDGNCWMQQNLALPGGTKLTSSDSDVNSDWTLPASATSWETSNYQAVQMKNGASGMTVNSSSTGDGKGWQSNYGNYYSWCAATAESCKTNRTGSAITSGTAAESICPKNWHLPTGGGSGASGTGEFGVLNGLNFTTVQQDPYRFPAAGDVSTNAQLYDPGTSGVYWSSTPYSNGNLAYNLYFNSGYFRPGTYNNYRYLGYSVRCVADY